jgi:hypothetical protein
MFVISGFVRDIDEMCPLLGRYAASNDNPLLTFRGSFLVPSSKAKKMGPRRRETPVKDYHWTLRNAPEDYRSHQLRILFQGNFFTKYRAA